MPVALQGKNTKMCHIVELYTYYSMNKQYVEGVQNEKNDYLTSVDNIAMYLHHFLAGSETMSLLLKDRGK